MATPLDVGLLQKFDVIFPFMFVLVLVYAILSRLAAFKDKHAIAFLIAFILAIMTLLSRIAVRTINLMAPWFVLLFIFIILVMIAYQAFGISEKSIIDVITGKEYGGTFAYWILALVLIIGIGSLATVISEEKGFTKLGAENATTPVGVGEGQYPAEQVGFWQTIVHPKVLGMVLILMIALFTINKLASSPEK